MIEVKDLDGREMNRFYGRQLIEPLKGYAARRGFRTVALGGLALGDVSGGLSMCFGGAFRFTA